MIGIVAGPKNATEQCGQPKPPVKSRVTSESIAATRLPFPLFGQIRFMRMWRVTVAITTLLLMAATIASPIVIHASNSRAFSSAEKMLDQHGGYLRFDLVDGNYVVDLPASMTEESLDAIVDQLLHLPTGFTYIGPGEERLFWINANNARLDDRAIETLSKLRISSISINGERLTDKSAVSFAHMEDLMLITIGACNFSTTAIENLKTAKPKATMLLGDRDGKAK